VITSGQNAKIKLVRSLFGRAKERRAADAFVAEGVRLVEDAFNAKGPIKFVLFSEGLNERGQQLIKMMKEEKVEVEEITSELLQSLSETETSQGIIAVLALTNLPSSGIPAPNLLTYILIPDQIRDPGNLGTLLRTAAAAGVDAVFIPPDTTDAFAPKVVRAGMGAHFRLPIISMSWDAISQQLTGKNIFIADANGETTHWDADFKAPLALIVGSEAEGVSAAACQLATQLIRIPMPGQMESLNAGVAGAVLMYEVVRQRAGLDTLRHSTGAKGGQ
jgi:TrmH family RNA methyltransferase